MISTSCLCVLVLLITTFLWQEGEAARILGVWPMEAPSHFFLGNKLFKELAARGHEVTMISPFPQKTPIKNYRDVPLKDMQKALQVHLSKFVNEDEKFSIFDLEKMPIWKEILLTAYIGSITSEIALEQENVQKLISDPKEKFDLIIMEMFHTEVFYGLAHKYNAPMIVLSTMGTSIWTDHLVGNPTPNTYTPGLFTEYSSHMTFLERFHNTLVDLAHNIYRKLVYFPQIDKTLHKFFPDAPPLNDLMYNKTAMILLNSHPAISDSKPHVPAMVEIGGFHVDEAKPLPKDLKEYMDNAPHGVILFSMGSNLKSSEMDDKTRDHILKAFGKLKQKVIWKWEVDDLPGKPNNVKIMKWCPQNDIMAHPNLRLFITHGGLLSTTEAVYHGVPVIGIPIFGDQKMNVANTERKGYGLSVDFAGLTEEKLTAVLKEMLSNPKYKITARKASQIIRAQPVRPIDAAVFWVNHVLEHKGADHFRSAAMDLEWWQLYSIDIIALVVLADIVVFAIFYYICKKLCCGWKSKKDLKNPKESKKKRN